MPRPRFEPFTDGASRENRTSSEAGNAAQSILRTAARLFAKNGYRGTALRDIAEEAGVTHPLIHYHWGSKRNLLAAVIKENQARMRAVAEQPAEAREMILALARENLAGSRLYLMTLARAFVEGMAPADWPGGFPPIEAILDALVGGPLGKAPSLPETEVRERVAVIVAMVVGWALIEDQLLDIVDLPPSERGGARETLLRSIAEVIRPVLPSNQRD